MTRNLSNLRLLLAGTSFVLLAACMMRQAPDETLADDGELSAAPPALQEVPFEEAEPASTPDASPADALAPKAELSEYSRQKRAEQPALQSAPYAGAPAAGGEYAVTESAAVSRDEDAGGSERKSVALGRAPLPS